MATIKEVSKKYGLTQDTLRYYERIGLIPPVNRLPNGIRDYNDEDCEWVNFIKCMRSSGISIETLHEYVKLYEMGNETIMQRKQLLIDERDQLIHRIEEMQSTLDRLDKKIDGYEERMLAKSK